MHTQRQLLELAKSQQGVTYTQLAAGLGISRQALSQFKLGAPLSSSMALQIAALTELDPAYVLACVEYQRAQRLERTETLPVWKKIAEHFAAEQRRALPPELTGKRPRR